MRVDLRTLKPNPIRNFKLDPIDNEVVERLTQSIRQDKFWGGAVCCQIGKDIHIIAGHHRVAAALRAGITHADLFVDSDMDEEAMVRVYSRENATQRGGNGIARIGCVASALRLVAKRQFQMVGEFSHHKKRPDNASTQGVGWRPILDFLKDVPGLTEYTVKQDLAIIKSGGAYAEIIESVKDEIAREAEEARIKAEQAERERQEAEELGREAEAEAKKEAEAEARKKASATAEAKAKAENAAKAATDTDKNQNRFDYVGVSKYLTTSRQIDEFRKSVTSPGIAPRLPVDQQAALAKQLVDDAAYLGAELSAEWIRNHISMYSYQASIFRYQASKEATRQARLADLRTDNHGSQHDFKVAVWRVYKAGQAVLRVIERFKKEKEEFFVYQDLEDALDCCRSTILELDRKLNRRGATREGQQERGTGERSQEISVFGKAT
jgi:hypothetical protein